MKSIILFFFFIGIILVLMGQNIADRDGTPPRVEYRYIPRDFTMDQYDRLPILSTFGKLFTQASPWERSIGYPSTYYRKKEEF